MGGYGKRPFVDDSSFATGYQTQKSPQHGSGGHSPIHPSGMPRFRTHTLYLVFGCAYFEIHGRVRTLTIPEFDCRFANETDITTIFTVTWSRTKNLPAITWYLGLYGFSNPPQTSAIQASVRTTGVTRSSKSSYDQSSSWGNGGTSPGHNPWDSNDPQSKNYTNGKSWL